LHLPKFVSTKIISGTFLKTTRIATMSLILRLRAAERRVNELLRRCGMLPNARRDVQTEQSITLALGLIGHPHAQRVAVPNRSWNIA
jgi:hypothetical protein